VGEGSAVANDAVQEASIHLETAKKLNAQNRFVEAEASCRHAVELLEGAANESWLARFAEAENALDQAVSISSGTGVMLTS
jgi:hypothetical protein